ncbi:MAG: helicase-related protein [Candidatus Magasanikbacteria bacterium]|nr:helicase-related protein [Candidatus Magasanikbacteria bacterium]
MPLDNRIIDNQNSNNLYRAISEAIGDDTQGIDIEVGYFYLCGFELLSKKLDKIKVRILVGSYIDPEAIPTLIMESMKKTSVNLDPFQPRSVPTSKQERVRALGEGIKKLANQTSIFDAPESQESYSILERKLEDGSLEIKMTETQAHGKCYVIHNKNAGKVFMGSSNFTYNGLVGQQEINETFDTEEKYKEYSNKFSERWADARNIVIQEKGKSDMFLRKFKDELWMNVVPTPYLMYVRLLNEIFGAEYEVDVTSASQATRGQYLNLSYQMDAVKMAIERLKNYDGAIIADVVGLGKSIIATTIAVNCPDLKTIIIAPPHLVPMWEDYAEEFKLRGPKVFSAGKIDEVYDKYKNSTEPILFILDEAHRYRNEDTQDYQLLHQLTRSNGENKVLILSATPFNNDPSDIFALIKLFQTPGAATLRTVENLSAKFADLANRYKTLRRFQANGAITTEQRKELDNKRDAIASELRRLLEPIIIRRSRIDLEKITRYRDDLKAQKIEFSKMNDPIIREYKLGNFTDLYLETINKIVPEKKIVGGLTGARYMPTTYALDIVDFTKKYPDFEDIRTAQMNVASFMRKLLVMRFESSRAAFQSTLQKFIDSHQRILDWVEKKQLVPISKKAYIPSPDEMPEEDAEEINSEEHAEFANTEVANNKKIVFVKLEDLNEKFVPELKHDISVLTDIYEKWFGSQSPFLSMPDPKLKQLTLDIQERLANDPNRKIVIFSMYADTVVYIGEELKNAGIPTFVYTAQNSNSDRKIIRENFDAGIPTDKQSDDFRVLVATDALSEGVNLNRAGRVINYDIPYNPTRVIQRVGRINRIDKKMFKELFIDNYFPTEHGEKEVNIRGVSTLKMQIFNSVVGNDSRTLTEDETPESFFIDEFRKATTEEESWDTVHREAYEQAKRNIQTMELAKKIPMRARIVRTNKPVQLGVGVGIRGQNKIYALETNGRAELVDAEKVLNHFAAKQDEVSEKADDQFGLVFAILKEKLFEKPPMGQMSRNRTEVVRILRSIRETQYQNYRDDLMKVVSDLDDLSEGQLKAIIKLAKKTDLSEDRLVEAIIEIAPEQQVKVSLDRQNNEAKSANLLLFTQEHRI